MRLNANDLRKIKEIKKFFDGEIYIFGSRVNDKKRGGDVDLYLIPKNNISSKEKVLLKMKIREFLEEELLIPVDVVFDNDTLRDEVLKNGYKVD
ncbi:nucleotidyltransferase domain-containing protein [Caminibacter sp.]